MNRDLRPSEDSTGSCPELDVPNRTPRDPDPEKTRRIRYEATGNFYFTEPSSRIVVRPPRLLLNTECVSDSRMPSALPIGRAGGAVHVMPPVGYGRRERIGHLRGMVVAGLALVTATVCGWCAVEWMFSATTTPTPVAPLAQLQTPAYAPVIARAPASEPGLPVSVGVRAVSQSRPRRVRARGGHPARSFHKVAPRSRRSRIARAVPVRGTLRVAKAAKPAKVANVVRRHGLVYPAPKAPAHPVFAPQAKLVTPAEFAARLGM